MIYLEKVMIRLNDWMNDGTQTYKLSIENNEIIIFDYLTNEHIATVYSNLSYNITKKINEIKTNIDLEEWIFYQFTNCKLVQILSTI
jgi:hypothetical protein